MQIKLDNLKTPSRDICVHCGEVSIKKTINDGIHKFAYFCGCKKIGSSGIKYGVSNYQIFNDKEMVEGIMSAKTKLIKKDGKNKIIIFECSLGHGEKCQLVKTGKSLYLKKEGEYYFVELK